MRSVVIGTAGHIDHGKTTLLRALTGIDADRLPEERARGMTIDVGFAHLDLDDASTLDFVDVPGHDRLVGNMLVGAGEIDAVLLVVAADDGPRAQTLEHLELLDALGHDLGVVAITKADVIEAERLANVRDALRALVDRTTLRGAPIVAVSGTTGLGVEALRSALVALRDVVLERDATRPHGPVRLAIDRVFSIKGRGDVVTGTLRGGSVAAGSLLRLEPAGAAVRVRDVQVRHGRAERADGGRTGLNVVVDAHARELLRRGRVLTAGPGVQGSSTWLVSIRRPTLLGESAGREPVAGTWPPKAGTTARLHLGTQQAGATIRPIGSSWNSVGDVEVVGDAEVVGVLRIAEPVAALAGEAAVLRDAGSSRVIGGVTMLDPAVPRGASRRRVTPQRLQGLADASTAAGFEAALLALHGALPAHRRAAIRASFDAPPDADTGLGIAPDVEAALRAAGIERVRERSEGVSADELRVGLFDDLRRLVTIDRSAQAGAAAAIERLVDTMVLDGLVARQNERVLDPARRSETDAALGSAMDRLEAALDLDVPPALSEAAAAAGCSAAGIRALDSAGRIVRVDDDLAWSRPRYEALRDRAVRMASGGPLTPAAFRDAIGGNRRVVMPLLEDLGRKGFLRRTDAGHVPGPRATVRA